jgi:hypothetical protein
LGPVCLILNRALVLILALSLLTVLTTPFTCGGISFERTYGGAEFDYGRSVRQTSDGGYIVAGETHSFGVGWGDVYLLKVDSLGDTLWSATFGGALYECGRSILETPDRGFIIAGETQSFGAGGNDVYLVKTDSLGNVMWTGTYGGGDYECGYSVKRTPDDDYVVAGETESYGAGGRDMYLVRTDFLGSLIMDTAYGGGSSERGFDVELTSDGGYVLAGHSSSFGAGADDIYLVKTDDSGSVAWTQTYGTSAAEWGRSVEERSNGGYFTAGETRSSGAFDLYLVIADSSGSMLWDATYGGVSHDRCMSGTQTTDGGFVMVGYTQSFGAGDWDVYVVRTDSVGDTLWTRTFGGSGEDRGAFVQQTHDSGFIVAGYTESFGAGGYDVYLIKMGPDGVVAKYDGAVLSIDSPPDTVVRDTDYAVAVTVKNLGNISLSGDVVATIEGYSDTVSIVDLPQDSSLQVSFTDWRAPAVDSITLDAEVCIFVSEDVDPSNDCFRKTIFVYDPTRVAEHSPILQLSGFSMSQNRPNPFHLRTLVFYSLPEASPVLLEVYDIAGRHVRTLVDGWFGPGDYLVQWEPTDRPPGVYFAKIKANGVTETKEMLLVR